MLAIDVHNHAMPLPLLEWLQHAGLADLSRSTDGIVLLDPSVSGVGKNTPLPLARSQYDPRTRLAEMDDIGVSAHAVSMPPFLYCSNSEDSRLVTTTIARGNDELARYVADGAGRLYGLGSIPLGFPDAADEARRCLDDLGFPGVAIGTRGGGKELDDPVNDDLWASARRTQRVHLRPPQRGSRRAPATRLLSTPAGRLPGGDGDQHRPDDLWPGVRTFRPHDVSGARWRVPTMAARSTRSRLAAQGRRAHHHAPTERIL